MEKLIAWPDNTSVIQKKNSYVTPDGEFPRVTSINRVLGLGKEYIINWAAAQEREAVIESCMMAVGSGVELPELLDSIRSGLGGAKAHIRALEKAGEIGVAVHGRLAWLLKAQLGDVQGPCPALGSEAAEIAFEAAEAWWKDAGLTPVKSEQIVWDKDWGYAGTVDLIAEDKNGKLGIIDFKTSKYTYPEHHLQVAAYMRATERWAPMSWAKLVRLPKSDKDAKFEVVDLGKLQDRTLSLLELQAAFKAARTLYGTFCEARNA